MPSPLLHHSALNDESGLSPMLEGYGAAVDAAPVRLRTSGVDQRFSREPPRRGPEARVRA